MDAVPMIIRCAIHQNPELRWDLHMDQQMTTIGRGNEAVPSNPEILQPSDQGITGVHLADPLIVLAWS